MNKYKKLAANTVVFAIGSFGSKILAFFLTRLYSDSFAGGTAEFNTKGILEMFANFLIPVVTFSIQDAIIRYGLDKNYEPKAVLSNAVTVFKYGVIGFVVLSPLLALYRDIRPYVPLLVLYIIVSGFRQISTQFARARGFVRLYAADGILCTLSLFLFNIIFIKIGGLGVTGFMLSVIGSDLLSGLTVWIAAKHGRFYSKKFVDRELLEVMLRFSVPLIPTALLWIITGFSDQLFVRHIVSPSSAGIYSGATKIPNLISMVSSVFYMAWNMSAITENDSKGRSKFYTQVFEAYQAMLTLAAGFIIVFSPFLNEMLFSKKQDTAYMECSVYTPMLVVAVLMMCYNQFLSSIYTVTKHTRNSFNTSLIAAGLNLVLNTLLIPKYEIYGAVAATFASYFVCYLIRIVDARRLIPFKVAHWRFALNLTVLVLLAVINASGGKLLVPASAAGLAVLTVLNFKPMMTTAKKILHRS
ncbi:MAG: polysaccharide biosynthesis C-terminal domain-containing protein [Oscillospiraceae bacterium]|nr:polysaccharide biosynthesis C-terminal domain-containing protein [Oscillospiraceae bacterium]